MRLITSFATNFIQPRSKVVFWFVEAESVDMEVESEAVDETTASTSLVATEKLVEREKKLPKAMFNRC